MLNKITQSLSSQNCRITPARERIIKYFLEADRPLSVIHILDLFKVDKVKIHKATVYREIEFLQNHDVIHVLNLGQSMLSYELNNLEHHHHFVCEKCGHTIDIISKEVEKSLRVFEKYLTNNEKVKVNSHFLKILGICSKCKK